ncbi:UNVERIFIED_CONTAM: hypothetical protein BEN50_21745, partial [Euhalothece sp. KZN 001]
VAPAAHSTKRRRGSTIMAFWQTPQSKGLITPPRPIYAGVVNYEVAEFTVSADFTAASDVLELTMLPAGAVPVRATLIGEGLGAINADIGFMSGTFGDVDDTRTVGDELFNGTSVNDNEADATALTLRAISSDRTKHRPIGATLSGDVAAGAAKKLTFIMEYVAA